MLFSSSSTGLEISHAGAAFALVEGTSASPRVVRVSYLPFEAGVVRSSLREPNVLDPEKFVSTLKAAHNLLLHTGGRLSLSLPDAAGRILLVDMEGRFKSRAEALDLIRWKLKKSMPFDPSDTHLDYQQLTVRENGDLALLVALVSKRVIEQYEELVVQAGLLPARIEFTSFSLCRLFERNLALQDDCLFVFYYGNTLGIVAFSQGIPEFVRSKEISAANGVDSRLFMEINNSLLVCRERFPEYVPSTVYCVASPETAKTFAEMVSEAAGYTPSILEVKTVVTPADTAPGDQAGLFPCSAAIGAALRSL